MKTLITGANGFVGQSLCIELLQQDHLVRTAVRPANIPTGNTEAVAIDAIDGETNWDEALSGIDVVIHLAARVHVMKDTSTDPMAEFLKVNLHGTVNLAQQAARAGVKRIVYVSSIKVNGERTGETASFTELDTPNPQDPYAVSKWQAEQALQRIAQETNLEVVTVRPPLVYGPGAKGNFISLLAAIDRGIPLPLASDSNSRSLVYVGNLVDALITCATHLAAAGQTYLISDGEDVSTAVLVEKIAQALGRSSRSFHFPPSLLRALAGLAGRSDQADRLLGSLRVSSEKIRSELSWFPPYTLEQGLRATAEWYRKARG